MTAKIVCRLFDADGQLLGWVEHAAVMRGDALLRSSGAVTIHVDVDGIPSEVSLHWCEANVEARVPIQIITHVLRGGAVTPFDRADMPMLSLGAMPIGLPAVTVGRPVLIGVPVGQMGARGSI